jgi:hypothetical protein
MDATEQLTYCFFSPSPLHAISPWTLCSVYVVKAAHVCIFYATSPAQHMHAPLPLYSTIHPSIHPFESTLHRSELMLFSLSGVS